MIIKKDGKFIKTMYENEKRHPCTYVSIEICREYNNDCEGCPVEQSSVYYTEQETLDRFNGVKK